MEHKSNVVMLWINQHCCIELTHLAYDNSINLTEKVNKVREPLKEGLDGYTSCSLKLILTKYPLVCECHTSSTVAPKETFLSYSPEL